MIPPVRDSDIPVTNARGIFDRGIAEYVLGALLLFAKDTLTNLSLMKEHRWQHRETHLLRGSRALVVGAGSIGREVATVLGAMGVSVVGTARNAREDAAFERVHAQQDLPDLLPEADYVIITAPLTPQTEGLFDADQFLRMKPGAVLVNVGRGPIVETSALLAALQSGRLGGVALDVFEEEPCTPTTLSGMNPTPCYPPIWPVTLLAGALRWGSNLLITFNAGKRESPEQPGQQGTRLCQ